MTREALRPRARRSRRKGRPVARACAESAACRRDDGDRHETDRPRDSILVEGSAAHCQRAPSIARSPRGTGRPESVVDRSDRVGGNVPSRLRTSASNVLERSGSRGGDQRRTAGEVRHRQSRRGLHARDNLGKPQARGLAADPPKSQTSRCSDERPRSGLRCSDERPPLRSADSAGRRRSRPDAILKGAHP